MLLRRVLSLALSVVLICPLFPCAHGVSAAAYCVIDADTDEVLYSDRADDEMPMASTTKIMTCLVALREADIHEEVVIPAAAVGVEGSSVYLQAGERLTLLDLLYALMLQSANDAAVAVAIAVSGSIEAFVARMNETAKELGLTHTCFADPHGLSSHGHYSTARDLCRLMRVAMEDEIFALITGEVRMQIPAPDGGIRTIVNHNRLLRSYDSCIGGKTGYTRVAGRCLVTAAERSGKRLICATLNAPDDWNDHRSLFEQGFSLYHEVALCEFAGIRQELPVVGGELHAVDVTNLDACSVMVRGDEPIRQVLELPRFLYAPVPGIEFATDDADILRRAGVSVGDAVFLQGNREVARVPLYPMMNVGKAPRELSIWEKISAWFTSFWEWFTGLWKK